ncbi:MAG TPA: hypothetical protein VFU22_12215 [Roseiflexaceae bacterium]|nr:hypothetical protein [Roseiflexaceae bacterium]
MKGKASRLTPAALATFIVALALYAYRELAARPFAADDYQWLLNVRGLSFGQLMRQAFNPSAQSHFYRPLVWLLFWAQTRAFGLDPRGFHAISLGLPLLNAGLLGWLAYRLTPKLRIENEQLRAPVQFSIPLLAMAIVALHPAPFEAVVWVSAQSELLAALLLLAAMLFWTMDDGRRAMDDGSGHTIVYCLSSIVFRPWSILATLALGLALLAKESAVIGLPLLFLVEPSKLQSFKPSNLQRFRPYLPPLLLTLAYVGLQIGIERRNYLLEQGGYGLGPQLLLNPLRSLALIVAPLPGTEHADAVWLVLVGALIAIVLLICWVSDFGLWKRLPQSKIATPKSKILIALAFTLLPTAPFVSPPDSRYLYLPVMAAALLIALGLYQGRRTKDERQPLPVSALSSFAFRLSSWTLILGIVWAAQGELHEREWRFAAASGPGGSLWRLASAVCAESHPDRMVIVEPPLAPPHTEAIVGLSCGERTHTRIVGRDQIDGAIKGHSVVIAFPNGSAQVERRT